MGSSKVVGPWLVCGDFINPLDLTDRVGSIVSLAERESFKNCVSLCGLSYIKSSGYFFTWSNKQHGDRRVFSRLDRMLGNDDWSVFTLIL